MKEILREIKKHDRIVIHRHQNPDGDALGSQFGLKQLLKENFPEKEILCIGDKKEFDTTSLRHLFKEGFDEVTPKQYLDALVIVCDTANIDRIQGNLFPSGNKLIKIDHHVSAEDFADIELVKNKVGSTCEILTYLAKEFKWTISKLAATYLLTGIITDTGRFMFSSVNEDTFGAASILAENGAKISSIVGKLNDRPLSLVRLQSIVLKKMTFSNGVCSYMMPKGLNKKLGVPYNQVLLLVSNVMSFNEAKYGIFASYDEKNKFWRASLRSKAKPINKVAEKYNGGGHELASGVKFTEKKVFHQIVSDLKKLNQTKE